MNKGLVYAFCGDGKGKTSACLGVMMRSVMMNRKVVWISWYKSSEWQVSEMKIASLFDNLEMYWGGKGFYFSGTHEKLGNRKKIDMKVTTVYDSASEDDHREAASQTLNMAMEILDSGTADLLILDEVLNAISDGLIESKDLIATLGMRKKTDVLISGRKISQLTMDCVDLVSEIHNLKHPFERGILAKKGLDY
jgi:cob(I)alamin adenosyltransferase